MGRPRTRIHGTEHVVPETIKNVAVHPHAGIWESKSAFFDWGHDHTGGASGAVIDLTDNLVFNGDFEYWRSYISPATPSGLALPDFWRASGNVEYEIYPSGQMGVRSLKITNPLSSIHKGLIGRNSFYQDIPAPSGKEYSPLPSGENFRGRVMTFGCWAKSATNSVSILGTGSLLLGYRDREDHWRDGVILSTDWQWITYTFTCDPMTDALRVMLYPNGPVLVDHVQLAIGKRLINEQTLKSESDREAWRNLNSIWTCGEPEMYYGEAARASTSGTYVMYPTKWGQDKIAGITCANSTSGVWVGVCNQGVTRVKCIYPVNAGDLLTAAAHPLYSGYSVSVHQVALAAADCGEVASASTSNTYAMALQSSGDLGPKVIDAFVQATLTWNVEAGGESRRSSIPISLAPVYPNTVMSARTSPVSGISGYDADDPIDTGWDGTHNYYRWSQNYGIRGRNFIFIFNASGNAIIAGDTSGYIQLGNAVGTSSGVIPASGGGMSVWLRSNEVYQETLAIGRIGKVWGEQIDRERIILKSSAEYASGLVYDNALADDLIPSEWSEVGFDERNGYLYASGYFHTSGAVTYADRLFSGHITPSGDYYYLEKFADDEFGEPPPGYYDGLHHRSDTPGYAWVQNRYDGDNRWVAPDGTNFVPSGIGMTSISGSYVRETTPYNSLTTRILIPDDYETWVSGSYVYNKINLSPKYYDSNGDLNSMMFDANGNMVLGYFMIDESVYPEVYSRAGVALGYQRAGINYYVYDCSGVLALSGIDVMSIERNKSTWTKTYIHMQDASGTFAPLEWFTVLWVLEGEAESSAYLGEAAFLYRNY